ncbi:MAG: LLM class flavin-dependent oxidoreductase [Phenylobacterium sp.]|uniref:LLM class flavin-dependent oxidoreductase n=1 Tax=Phenylobacterium sp. TaxID=1871053 RepID=UPI001A488CE5|nr:LLM class flavin-dependent oxidoreductase [Phenylobacterium sp.]MBL8555635.1 LLM class flavin-dependent oxidoreductase [Phenylobacterium sp.]
MARMKFGAFLAPHHPIGEHPMLQMRNDIKFAAHLDELGFDEFWVGEHHSTGWEVIASPEMFLAAVAERTQRIRLGTGVVSLPYHHPFTVAQRMVQLDHMSRGRVIFGTGPGALPSDAYMLGIDPMTQRDRQDEAIGVLQRLFRGERVTHESDWFTLKDARLQLFPLQEELPMVTASSISPSGMTLAGKYGIGVLSIGSNSDAGLAALPTQWGFAEQAAAKHGQTVSRDNWRVLMTWHIAETREQAIAESAQGLMHWHNEYTVGTLMRPGADAFKTPEEAIEQTAFSPGSAAVIGTPDDLVAAIRKLAASAGGFGTVLGFVHDWANREATNRSWELVARYVIPEVHGLLDGYRDSRAYVVEHREWFERAGQAVLAKIMSHEGAAKALQEGMQAQTAMRSPNAPDLNKAAKEAAKAEK